VAKLEKYVLVMHRIYWLWHNCSKNWWQLYHIKNWYIMICT